MLADCFYLTEDLSSQGQECRLYTDIPREELLPAPAPGPGAPPDGLLDATRRMLSLTADERPSMSEVLLLPNTFQEEHAAALRAEDQAPALRAASLARALQSARGRQGRRRVEVSRENVLDTLAPIVNGMSAAQLRGNWEVSFEGEAGIDVGGVHVDLITEACKDFEARCVDVVEGSDGMWRLKPSCSEALAMAMGRLVCHALCQEPPIPLCLRLCSGLYQAALGSQDAHLYTLGSFYALPHCCSSLGRSYSSLGSTHCSGGWRAQREGGLDGARDSTRYTSGGSVRLILVETSCGSINRHR